MFVDTDGVLPCVVSGEKYGPLLMDRSALLQVVRHPGRDHVDAHPVQCVWLGDVWAPSICTAHLGDASVCRGVVQSIRSDQDRFAAWLSCSAAGIHLLEGVRHCQLLRQTPGGCSRPPLFGVGRISPPLPTRHPNSHLLSRDSYGSRVGPSQPA